MTCKFKLCYRSESHFSRLELKFLRYFCLFWRAATCMWQNVKAWIDFLASSFACFSVSCSFYTNNWLCLFCCAPPCCCNRCLNRSDLASHKCQQRNLLVPDPTVTSARRAAVQCKTHTQGEEWCVSVRAKWLEAPPRQASSLWGVCCYQIGSLARWLQSLSIFVCM